MKRIYTAQEQIEALQDLRDSAQSRIQGLFNRPRETLDPSDIAYLASISGHYMFVNMNRNGLDSSDSFNTTIPKKGERGDTE